MTNLAPLIANAHLHIDLITSRNNSRQSGQNTIGTNISATVSSTKGIGQLSKLGGGEAVGEIRRRGGNAISNSGVKGINNHHVDVGRVGNANTIYPLAKVEDASSNLIPVNSNLDVQRFGVDSNFLVVQTLNSTFLNALGLTRNIEGVVAVYKETSGVAPSNVADVSKAVKLVGNDSGDNGGHNLGNNSSKILTERSVLVYLGITNHTNLEVLGRETSTLHGELNELLDELLVGSLIVINTIIRHHGKNILLALGIGGVCDILLNNIYARLEKNLLLLVHRGVTGTLFINSKKLTSNIHKNVTSLSKICQQSRYMEGDYIGGNIGVNALGNGNLTVNREIIASALLGSRSKGHLASSSSSKLVVSNSSLKSAVSNHHNILVTQNTSTNGNTSLGNEVNSTNANTIGINAITNGLNNGQVDYAQALASSIGGGSSQTNIKVSDSSVLASSLGIGSGVNGVSSVAAQNYERCVLNSDILATILHQNGTQVGIIKLRTHLEGLEKIISHYKIPPKNYLNLVEVVNNLIFLCRSSSCRISNFGRNFLLCSIFTIR
nr:MAG TPA: hypothetical protein [Caudoviricetes sp.]